jgi:Trk-type K+ transport system membrane component
MERTRREGGQTQEADGKAADEQAPALWRSALGWIGGIVFLVALAMLMVYLGSLIG